MRWPELKKASPSQRRGAQFESKCLKWAFGSTDLRIYGGLVGWLAGWLVGWLLGWLAGWLDGSLVRWFVCWFVGSLVRSWVRWFVGRSVRRLIGRSVGWWVAWLIGWFVASLLRWFIGSLVLFLFFACFVVVTFVRSCAMDRAVGQPYEVPLKGSQVVPTGSNNESNTIGHVVQTLARPFESGSKRRLFATAGVKNQNYGIKA